MSDPLTWSPISLGRWFGTSVRVHITLIVFVVFRLLATAVSLAAKGELSQLPQTVCWLALLLLSLAIHELAHAMAAYWLDCDQDEVHIWPLGSLAGPSFVPRSSEHMLVAGAGPVANGLIVLVTAIGLTVFGGAHFVWNPFGNEETVKNVVIHHGGAPRLTSTGEFAPALSPVWIAGWFGYLNYILLLANLFIPALPFDCGRILRAYLSSTSVVSSRESIAAPWTAARSDCCC